MSRRSNRRLRSRLALTALVAVACAVMAPLAFGAPQSGEQIQLPTTREDFFSPGTQPESDPYVFTPVYGSNNCNFCHSDYSPDYAPLDTWVASVMGQSARDPVWNAARTIANQDAAGSGVFCIRCHAPGAWLGNRGQDGTTADFIPEDFDGVTCHFCHRAVNPALGKESAIGYPENADPTPDVEIVKALLGEGLAPIGHGNGQFVIDPRDVRRGPFSDIPDNMHGYSQWAEPVDLITSPFHQESEFCAACHDVSNPVFELTTNGTFVPGAMNSPHPTLDPTHMFPEQRTYSEWKNSDFASVGVYFADGRFGGNNKGPMQSCQDCHMPDQQMGGCTFYEFPPFFERADMPQHALNGANHWVVSAIMQQLGKDAPFYGLTPERVEAAKARTIQMLRDASDLSLTLDEGGDVIARVTNQSGHKLPTGYPEGRRMWLNVKFFNQYDDLIAEHGAYDYDEALLNEDTKIYETRHGFDETVAKATGLPAGENFHLALANKRYFDNRIPPRGFTNAAFEEAGCAPVEYEYADGQYWDDTAFAVPKETTKVVVSLLHEVATREYMEFLRDTNVTNDDGQIAYDLWEQFGKGVVIEMDTAEIEVQSCGTGDVNCDGYVNGADLTVLLGAWGECPGCAADCSGDGVVNGADITIVLGNWG